VSTWRWWHHLAALARRIPTGGGCWVHGRAATADRDSKKRVPIGYAYVHTAVDACSRIAYTEVLDDEQAVTAAAFWQRTVAFFAGQGIRVERVMTDNDSCYAPGPVGPSVIQILRFSVITLFPSPW
jgi:hypothetical protein